MKIPDQRRIRAQKFKKIGNSAKFLNAIQKLDNIDAFARQQSHVPSDQSLTSNRAKNLPTLGIINYDQEYDQFGIPTSQPSSRRPLFVNTGRANDGNEFELGGSQLKILSPDPKLYHLQ